MSDNPATQKQQNVLADFGYNPKINFDEATTIIDAIANNGWKRPEADGAPVTPVAATAAPSNRPEGNPCTAKQAACLTKFGLDPNVTFDQARVELDKLAANDWQLPSATPATNAPASATAAPAGGGYDADLPSFG